jgi:FkbM family methyltransferase
MQNSDLFEGLAVQKLAAENPISYIDIGTRGGFQDDLASLAFAVDAIGFEPEKQAFDQISETSDGPWRSARMLPYAIGGMNGRQTLSIAADPISTTLLTPDLSIGERFDKTQFYDVRSQIKVDTRTLDAALSDIELASRDFLKIDIEGAELDVFIGAPETVKNLLAVKTEVSFLPHRKEQPLAHDIAAFFNDRGFELIDLIEPAHWRREGYVIHPYMSPEKVPYTRGQMVQADYLFFRSPESLGDDVSAKIRLGLIAMATGYFDTALMVLESPDVADLLMKDFSCSPVDMVAPASRLYGRSMLKTAIWRQLRGLVPLIRYLRRY